MVRRDKRLAHGPHKDETVWESLIVTGLRVLLGTLLLLCFVNTTLPP
jgi:hypothetical protein